MPDSPLPGLVTVTRSELRQPDGPLPMNFIVLPETPGDTEEVAAPRAGRSDAVAAFEAAAPAPPAAGSMEEAARSSAVDRAPLFSQDDEMPVLTVRAEPPADAFADRSDDSGSPEAFAPGTFGPKLQHPDEPALHADPEAAPQSFAARPRSTGSRGRAWRVALSIALLLALLAAAGWWWFSQHGAAWPAM